MSGNRTWIYCRIAHGSVLGPDAIEMQRHRLEWYAAQHGLAVVGSSEDCQPGITMDRPGVQKMNQAVEDLLWDFCDEHGIDLPIDEMDILIENTIKTAMSRY